MKTPTGLCLQNVVPFTLRGSFAFGGAGNSQLYPQIGLLDTFRAPQPYALTGFQISSSMVDEYSSALLDPRDPYGVVLVVGTNASRLAFSDSMYALIAHMSTTTDGNEALDTAVAFGQFGVVIPSGSYISLYGFRPGPSAIPGSNYAVTSVANLFLVPTV